jgi:hypothetical protein
MVVLVSRTPTSSTDHGASLLKVVHVDSPASYRDRRMTLYPPNATAAGEIEGRVDDRGPGG